MSVSDQAVNRNPTALLRFLGLSGPDAPNRLNDAVDGTVDLLPWWAFSSEQSVIGTFTPGVAVLGFFAVNVVPAGQRWYISQFSINSSVAAAHQYQLVCAYDELATSAIHLVGEVGPLVNALGRVPAIGISSRKDFVILSPSDRIGCFVSTNVGAAPAAVFVNYKYAVFTA